MDKGSWGHNIQLRTDAHAQQVLTCLWTWQLFTLAWAWHYVAAAWLVHFIGLSDDVLDIIAQLCSLSWIYNEMLSDLLIQLYKIMEAKNNCNASTKGLQNILDLLEKTHSDQCDHLSYMAVNVWPVQHKKSRVLFQIQLSLLQSLRLNPIANFYPYCLFSSASLPLITEKK